MSYYDQEPEGIRTDAGYVTFDTYGNPTLLRHANGGRYNYSLGTLWRLYQRDQLPHWCTQVPEITEYISATEVKIRARGEDPFTSAGVSGDEVYFDDMRHGTRISRKLRDLQADLKRGRTLPDIYNTPDIRRALGLPLEPAKEPGVPEGTGSASTKPGGAKKA